MSVLIERLELRKDLCEILKSDYVALLGQRGSGCKTLVKLIATNKSPLPGMKFIAVALPQGVQDRDRFMKIFLNNLIDASIQIPPQPDLCNQFRQAVARDPECPVILQIRSILDLLGKKSTTNYLVIVLHALTSIAEEPLKDLLLLLREYHRQIGIPGQGGEKLRFLVVGGAPLWNLCCHKPSDLESPFNIAKRIFVKGFSYQEVQSKFTEMGIEQALNLTDLADGVPSLVELISQETEYFEDLSSCFEPLENSWNSLSIYAQQALKKLAESGQEFPSYQLDHQCPHIPKFYDSPIWQEVFWAGFLRLRYRKLTWRSPIHLAFVITQAQIDTDVSKSTLFRNSLLERLEYLEETLKSSINARKLAECTEELVSLTVHSANVELVPLLEMILEGKSKSTILVSLKQIATESPKEWIRNLSNLQIQSQTPFNKILIEAVFSRIADDIRVGKNRQSKQEFSQEEEVILSYMNISGPQSKKLTYALMDAFPNKASLEQMLSFELDKNLDSIAGGSNLQVIVFNLIKVSKAENWIEDLIAAARRSNPGNLSLQAIAEELLQNSQPEVISIPNTPIQQNTQQQKILILTAIPLGLRLDQEIREIEDAIRRASRRDLFDIRTRTAVRPKDIRRAIAEEKPQIVHFCGHGLEDGSLLLEDDGGNEKPVPPQGLALLFRLHADYVNCVLLNACNSLESANAISQHINYAIGMNQPIEDKTAIAFTQGFYDALGYEVKDSNQDIFQRAFDEGLVAIAMEDFSQESIPVMKKKL
ncbi:effector-associated domain EAD1-containing protein [Mastigocoleus testarum]|nr:effector-associated domain EAD1-containing protein [Mastigocoleus testarum]